MIFNNRNSLNPDHSAIWMLQCARKCLCAIIANHIYAETIHVNISLLSCLNSGSRNSSLNVSHFTIRTLQRTRKWLCSLIANSIPSEPVAYQHQFTLVVYYDMYTDNTLVTLFGLCCNELAIDFASFAPIPLWILFQWVSDLKRLLSEWANAHSTIPTFPCSIAFK